MRLEAKDGAFFEMFIVDYQFPEILGGEDGNWLLINYSMSDTRHIWTSTDPCMQTWDMPSLADWLEKRCHGPIFQPEEKPGGWKPGYWWNKDQEYFDFFECTDPVITFICTQDDSNREVLRVIVDQGYVGVTIVFELDFLFDEIDLMSAAGSLRKQSAKFPERLGR